MAGQTEPDVRGWRPESWSQNEVYLYGVDLFNARYWWEAHAQWEILWKATRQEALSGCFLQGLIQTAAALLQSRLGHHAGARKLAHQAAEKLRRVAREQRGRRFMGVDVDRVIDHLDGVSDTGGRRDRAPLELELA